MWQVLKIIHLNSLQVMPNIKPAMPDKQLDSGPLPEQFANQRITTFYWDSYITNTHQRLLKMPGFFLHVSILFTQIHILLGLPRWPSGKGVRLVSRRSRVRITLAQGFFWGRVIPVT